LAVGEVTWGDFSTIFNVRFQSVTHVFLYATMVDVVHMYKRCPYVC